MSTNYVAFFIHIFTTNVYNKCTLINTIYKRINNEVYDEVYNAMTQIRHKIACR